MIKISFLSSSIRYDIDIERMPNMLGLLNTKRGSFSIHIRTDKPDVELQRISNIVKAIILSDPTFSTIEDQLIKSGFSEPYYHDAIDVIIGQIQSDFSLIQEEIETYNLLTSPGLLMKSLSEIEVFIEKIVTFNQEIHLLIPHSPPNFSFYLSRCEQLTLRVRHILSMKEKKIAKGTLLPQTIDQLQSIRSLQLEYPHWCEKCDFMDLDYLLIFDIELLEPTMYQKNRLSILKLSVMYRADQDRYSALTHAWIYLGSLYRKKYSLTFHQMLFFFSYARKKIGGNNAFSLHQYGLPRLQNEMYTNLAKPPYQEILEKLVRKYPTTKESGSYSTRVILDGEEILLSEIHPCMQKLDHTKCHYIPRVLAHVEKIYEKAKTSSDRDEIIYLSGKIFWWLCQAKPWTLGDPSIVEMLFRSLWTEKEIEQPLWNPSIIPWVEVSTEFDVEIFAHNFSTLFCWS